MPKKQRIYDYFYEFASEALHIVFKNFIKSMTSCLSKLKVTPSFGFAFKIPDDPTAINTYSLGQLWYVLFSFLFKFTTYFFMLHFTEMSIKVYITLPHFWLLFLFFSNFLPRITLFCFQLYMFSNFSCMFLNPNDLFQFEL